jgi:hypothetical protein
MATVLSWRSVGLLRRQSACCSALVIGRQKKALKSLCERLFGFYFFYLSVGARMIARNLILHSVMDAHCTVGTF